MKKLLKVFDSFLRIVPYLIVFIGSLFLPSDPDLGWHLKYGEYFFQHGTILRENTFATLMPHFYWADVSWGTDIITYVIYTLGGFLGLTLASAAIVTLTFFIISKAAKLALWDEIFLFPLLLYLENPINSVSFRGQQISLLFIGVLFYLISLYKKNSKILYLTIPLFLVWVNLHGQFLLGLGLFGGWILFYLGQKMFRDRKEVLFLGSIFFLDCLVTFINPFGIGLHREALSYLGNPLVKDIAEFLPFPALSYTWWNQVVVAIFLCLGFVFLYFEGKLSPKIPTLGVILLLYILSFGVRRYAWPAYYLILPILKPLTNFFKPTGKTSLRIVSTLLVVIVFFVVASEKYPLTQFQSNNWDTYCTSKNTICSPKSAQFIIDHKLTENLYSLYGWGGWLIWKYPQIKPTIDGRMHLWKDEKGYSGFEDYWGYEQNMKDIQDSSYDVVYMSPDKPVYSRLLDLVQQRKWKLAYQDDYAGVFVRN